MTPRQKQLYDYLAEKLRGGGVCPSYTEMGLAIGLKSNSGVQRMVVALEELGFLHRHPGKARSIVLGKREMPLPRLHLFREYVRACMRAGVEPEALQTVLRVEAEVYGRGQ